MTDRVSPPVKFPLLSGLLALALAVSACGGGAAATATTAPTREPTPTTAPTLAPTATKPPATKTPVPEPTATDVPVVELGDEQLNDVGGFAFPVVEGYTLDVQDGMVNMSAPDADPDTGPSLLLIGGPNTNNVTFNSIFDSYTGEMDDVDVSNPQERSIGGADAQIVDYTATAAGQEIAGRFAFALTDDETQVFVFIAAAPADLWPAFEATYTAVEEAIRLYPPSGAAEGTLIRQWATSAQASSAFGVTSWTADKALGEPNVATCSDNGEAWASASSSGVDWLEVYYATPVVPTEINIYESYNPGQVVAVELIAADGSEEVVYESTPVKIEDCPAVLTIPVEVDYEIVGVRVRVDQSVLRTWNEIDAVELVGLSYAGSAPAPTGDALEQWASTAEASSQFGEAGWSAFEATGAPDVTGCGDSVFAWASLPRTGVEWLEVYFDEPVFGAWAEIHQSFNPSQVILVEAIDTDGAYYEVYAAEPEVLTACPFVLEVPLTAVDTPIVGLRITVDQTAINNWNEIDAVKLVGIP